MWLLSLSARLSLDYFWQPRSIRLFKYLVYLKNEWTLQKLGANVELMHKLSDL